MSNHFTYLARRTRFSKNAIFFEIFDMHSFAIDILEESEQRNFQRREGLSLLVGSIA